MNFSLLWRRICLRVRSSSQPQTRVEPQGGLDPDQMLTTRRAACNRALSTANDSFVSTVFYVMILVGGAFYLRFVAVPLNSVEHARDMYRTKGGEGTSGGATVSAYWFFSLPWMVMWGFASSAFLTMTLVADPGIVSWRKRELLEPTESPSSSTPPHRESMAVIHNRIHTGEGLDTSPPGPIVPNVLFRTNQTTQCLHNRGAGATSTTVTSEQQRVRGNENHDVLSGRVDETVARYSEKTPLQFQGDIHALSEPSLLPQSIYTTAAEEKIFGGTEVYYCPVCWVYIDGFDHHCGVIGACIGKGTMPLFVLFLASVTVYCGSALFFIGHKIVIWFHYSEGGILGTPNTESSPSSLTPSPSSVKGGTPSLSTSPVSWSNSVQSAIEQVVEPAVLFGLMFVSVMATAFCGGLFLYYSSRIALGLHSIVRRRLSGVSDLDDVRTKIFTKATFPDLNVLRLTHLYQSIAVEGLFQFKLAPCFGIVHQGPSMKYYNKDLVE